ncbi:FAD-binding oxidoreductase [Comamonas aquatica]|uniref:FAD-binding oxidoreductase n=1 Tax=Comamonas aquatica TaxID=225991 RepID=A0AA42W5U5_9BURK|nr:FAD-binding oxidoreductase [Comamonas aquatica]MDH1429851.1 FAD-binding oxidoreductase [Comamonas aquatica]MDH1607469.1 FAD-binding oxidoreductase [Comamonas aquatica]MDH1619217.1 FAD-binding oxidoreductase [Comamonas aquatica]MDH2007200.1 FAD-binding oxidoreductase [Comamonas aquatica]
MALITLSSGKSFETSSDSTILDSATQSHVGLPYSCKTGRCSTCKCKVVSGETKVLVAELGLTEVEKSDGWILSCARTATTDLVLEVEDLGGVAIPEAKTLACRISSLETLAPDVIKVVLRLPPNVALNFIPGQYIDVIGPGGIRRSYSLANAPKADNTLELHIRAVEKGVMSQYWFNQSTVNNLLRLHGPQGTFFLRKIAQRDLIFLATGTGIAPVKAMLEGLPTLSEDQQPQSITVIWGARHEHDLYFDVASLPGVQKYIPVLSRAEATWQGEQGYVQDVLLRHISDLRNAVVYACGSDSMIHSAKSTLTAASLNSHNFYSDAFVCSGTLAQ